MTTAKTTTQTEIAITIAKAAAMQTQIVTVIDVTIIVTKEVEEATVMMTGKKEIAIMLVTKASYTTWRKSAVTLAPNLRAIDADTAAFQAAATLILILCQSIATKVMTTTMWRTPTWTWMKE
eukprot:13018667-Ditylum_brightwellii.AAC.1